MTTIKTKKKKNSTVLLYYKDLHDLSLSLLSAYSLHLTCRLFSSLSSSAGATPTAAGMLGEKEKIRVSREKVRPSDMHLQLYLSPLYFRFFRSPASRSSRGVPSRLLHCPFALLMTTPQVYYPRHPSYPETVTTPKSFALSLGLLLQPFLHSSPVLAVGQVDLEFVGSVLRNGGVQLLRAVVALDPRHPYPSDPGAACCRRGR